MDKVALLLNKTSNQRFGKQNLKPFYILLIFFSISYLFFVNDDKINNRYQKFFSKIFTSLKNPVDLILSEAF